MNPGLSLLWTLWFNYIVNVAIISSKFLWWKVVGVNLLQQTSALFTSGDQWILLPGEDE